MIHASSSYRALPDPALNAPSENGQIARFLSGIGQRAQIVPPRLHR